MDAERMMMQKQIDNLRERLEIVKRQRDAAIADVLKDCDTCKHNVKDIECSFCDCCIFVESDKKPCCSCHDLDRWEWRGLTYENGGKTDD